MIKALKDQNFEWNELAHSTFVEIKQKLTSAPILALCSFSKIFEVEWDPFEVGIGAVLS